MDNQHKMIKGYRDLSQAEIDMMNEVNALGSAAEDLIAKVEAHVQANLTAGTTVANNPTRWIAIGRSDLQTGLMALTRAIAKPTFF